MLNIYILNYVYSGRLGYIKYEFYFLSFCFFLFLGFLFFYFFIFHFFLVWLHIIPTRILFWLTCSSSVCLKVALQRFVTHLGTSSGCHCTQVCPLCLSSGEMLLPQRSVPNWMFVLVRLLLYSPFLPLVLNFVSNFPPSVLA